MPPVATVVPCEPVGTTQVPLERVVHMLPPVQVVSPLSGKCVGSGQNAAAEGQGGGDDGISRGEAQCAAANRKGPGAGNRCRTQEIGDAVPLAVVLPVTL